MSVTSLSNSFAALVRPSKSARVNSCGRTARCARRDFPDAFSGPVEGSCKAKSIIVTAGNHIGCGCNYLPFWYQPQAARTGPRGSPPGSRLLEKRCSADFRLRLKLFNKIGLFRE